MASRSAGCDLNQPGRRCVVVTTEPYRIDISGRTIVKVLSAALVVWLWMRLWQWGAAAHRRIEQMREH
jgi:hypothetical protein